MLLSGLVEIVGQLPGAGAGEGVAGCAGWSAIQAATRGHPCLCVVTSTGGKVGEGADSGPVDVEKLHRGEVTITTITTRYQDH